MKKLVTVVLMFVTLINYAQKKSNGTIYIDHPAINVVEEMTKAMVAGDVQKVGSFLADDFKSYDGVSTNSNDKGDDKASYLQDVKAWHDQLDYYSIVRWGGAYPDALEYKKDNDKNEVWVQTWEKLKGVHKATGVKVDMPMHRLFIVNKDNKIKTIINYMNNDITTEIRESMNERTNGTIYNRHEYINKIKKMVYAFENKDYVKAYADYADDARFSTLKNMNTNGISLQDQKALDKKILEQFDLVSIDMVGYPDYLHYELGNANYVLSWWNYNIVRKSDKKAFVLPIHFSDTFNKDGKVIREMAYFDESMLN